MYIKEKEYVCRDNHEPRVTMKINEGRQKEYARKNW